MKILSKNSKATSAFLARGWVLAAFLTVISWGVMALAQEPPWAEDTLSISDVFNSTRTYPDDSVADLTELMTTLSSRYVSNMSHREHRMSVWVIKHGNRGIEYGEPSLTRSFFSTDLDEEGRPPFSIKLAFTKSHAVSGYHSYLNRVIEEPRGYTINGPYVRYHIVCQLQVMDSGKWADIGSPANGYSYIHFSPEIYRKEEHNDR